MGAYQKDYQESREKELEFESFLKDQNLKTETTDPKEYFPYWDIRTTGCTCTDKTKVTKFEVKYLRQNNTIYVEDGQLVDGKIIPCGLSITESDFYVFTFKNDEKFYTIPVKKLKYLVQNNTKTYYDHNNYHISVFTAEYLLPFCKVHNPIIQSD